MSEAMMLPFHATLTYTLLSLNNIEMNQLVKDNKCARFYDFNQEQLVNAIDYKGKCELGMYIFPDYKGTDQPNPYISRWCSKNISGPVVIFESSDKNPRKKWNNGGRDCYLNLGSRRRK